MSRLIVDGICHTYNSKPILNTITFVLQEGEIGCLMGPSGSGKSTVLLCIAGLESITAGSIHLGERLLSDRKTNCPPEQRRIGMVFQDFALFPHLTIYANVAFGLHDTDKAQSDAAVQEVMALCDISDLAQAYPHEISGGQQQRVALARALATQPDLLLLDEPLSRLDAALHEKISRQLRDILKAKKQTTLVVTHNQNEAFLIADSGGVINEGAICQWDKIEYLYHRPNCTFVAEFVGEGFLLSAAVTADGEVENQLGRLGKYSTKDYPLIRNGEKVKILLRPDNIIVDKTQGARATVTRRIFRGATTHYTLRLDNDEQVISVMPSGRVFSTGDTVFVRATVPQLTLFPAI